MDVTIFRTGDLVEADAVADALQRKGVPFYRRVESFSGLQLAMPVNAAPGIGTYWLIPVPEEAERDAMRVIERLPFRPNAAPSWPSNNTK